MMALIIVNLTGCAETRIADKANSGLHILSHEITIHKFGGEVVQATATVYGKAQNSTNHTFNLASIEVNFYDADGKLLDKSSTVKENLRPGEIWNFSVQSSGPDIWKAVDYDIAVTIKE